MTAGTRSVRMVRHIRVSSVAEFRTAQAAGFLWPMMANRLVGTPQFSALLRDLQQQMIDRFSRVVPAGLSAEVVYVADAGEVHADLQFAHEVSDIGAIAVRVRCSRS
jgi:hypothetical protein